MVVHSHLSRLGSVSSCGRQSTWRIWRLARPVHYHRRGMGGMAASQFWYRSPVYSLSDCATVQKGLDWELAPRPDEGGSALFSERLVWASLFLRPWCSLITNDFLAPPNPRVHPTSPQSGLPGDAPAVRPQKLDDETKQDRPRHFPRAFRRALCLCSASHLSVRFLAWSGRAVRRPALENHGRSRGTASNAIRELPSEARRPNLRGPVGPDRPEFGEVSHEFRQDPVLRRS